MSKLSIAGYTWILSVLFHMHYWLYQDSLLFEATFGEDLSVHIPYLFKALIWPYFYFI